MTSIPRFARFDGYETADMKEFLKQGRIELHLERRTDKQFQCYRCGTPMATIRGRYRQRLVGMPIFGYESRICFWRLQGHCEPCGKARSEAVEFVSRESPHLTQEYAWWLGRLCEIAPVSRAAELVGMNGRRLWELDYRRMKRMLEHYRIPEVRRISVDEVYARKKPKYAGESRDERFFTVITDLDTHRVLWVSDSRRQSALEQFFLIIGKEASARIEIVACDQHEAYAAAVRKHCPKAEVIWDRFHLMQAFEEAVNETRKELHEEQPRSSELSKLTRGQYRFMFLKKEKRRTEEERLHINSVLRENTKFAKLEIIKERMLSFFDQPDEDQAKLVFEEVGNWIWQEHFRPLMRWYANLELGWNTLRNYFRHRVTSALSEGVNNVIKALKRRAYGYKNMHYFKLKIMQACGYLNSRYIPTSHSLLT